MLICYEVRFSYLMLQLYLLRRKIIELNFRDGKKIDTYDGAKTLEGLKEYLKKMRRGGKSSDKEPGKAKKHATPVKSKKKKSEKVDL